jgi:hypothetical protein
MREGTTARVAAWWLLLAAPLPPVLAQWQASLTYQSRGRYSEGVRTAPSTGVSLDLLSALVDYQEPYKDLPPAFRAMFYLPIQEPVYLAIREVAARYFYWLDQVQPVSGWQAGRPNRFEWPTATVVRALTSRQSAPLTLDDLGATARLGSQSPGKLERVAPVALYHSRPPQSVEGYCFVFKPDSRMRLLFEVFADGRAKPLESQLFPSVLAGQPHPIRWKAKEWPDGWYHLMVSGYVLSTNTQVDGKVSFYHVRRLGN